VLSFPLRVEDLRRIRNQAYPESRNKFQYVIISTFLFSAVYSMWASAIVILNMTRDHTGFCAEFSHIVLEFMKTRVGEGRRCAQHEIKATNLNFDAFTHRTRQNEPPFHSPSLRLHKYPAKRSHQSIQIEYDYIIKKSWLTPVRISSPSIVIELLPSRALPHDLNKTLMTVRIQSSLHGRVRVILGISTLVSIN
jgi:hypothetical protein